MSELVTFYRAYGFLDGDTWRIPLQAWVHERRRFEAALELLPALLNVSHPEGLANFQKRFQDFVADSSLSNDSPSASTKIPRRRTEP